MKQRKSFSYSKVPMFSNLSFSVMGESKDFLKDQTQLHKFRISIRLIHFSTKINFIAKVFDITLMKTIN